MEKHVRIESLENRRLFSFMPGLTHPAATPTTPRMTVPKTHATDPLTQVATPSLIGNWSGRVNVKFGFITKGFDMSLVVTEQTTDSLHGTVTIDGRLYT